MLTEHGGIYNGPHLHAALKCLDAGFRENAVSWMERDLRELCDLPWPIDPASLVAVTGPSLRINDPRVIEFKWLVPEMIGEAI